MDLNTEPTSELRFRVTRGETIQTLRTSVNSFNWAMSRKADMNTSCYIAMLAAPDLIVRRILLVEEQRNATISVTSRVET